MSDAISPADQHVSGASLGASESLRSRLRLSGPAKTRLFYAMFVLAAAVKIWLVLGFAMRAGGDAKEDDRLFMALAESILSGQWLGPYTEYTLVKCPFFPIWISAMFWLNVPLLVSYQLLHAGACFLLAVAVRPIMPQRAARFALFMWFLFDPIMYSYMASHVVRDAINTPMTTIILTSMIAILARLERPPRELLGWSLLLGATLAAFWTSREEAIWIAPGLCAALLYASAFVWRRRGQALVKVVILVLPGVMCACGVYAVCGLNYRYYGVFELSDFKSDAFKRANGALMRVKYDSWNRFVNVPQEVRMKVYEVSPAFAELKSFLDGPPGEAWGNGAEQWLEGGTPSPKDIRGGFFVWAMRQAAEINGHYTSALEAQAYFNRVADEINAACEDGRLECGRERASMMPPWRNEYVPLLLEAMSIGVWNQVTLEGVEVRELASTGPIELRQIFADLGRARLTPDETGAGGTPTPPNQANLNEFRFEVLHILNGIFRKLVPLVTVCGVAAFVLMLLRDLRSRSLSLLLAINIVLTVFFASRLAVMCAVTVMSFDTMKVPYITPLGPILQLFCCLALYNLGTLRTSGRAAPPAEHTLDA